jgi:hypothetical protein
MGCLYIRQALSCLPLVVEALILDSPLQVFWSVHYFPLWSWLFCQEEFLLL